MNRENAITVARTASGYVVAIRGQGTRHASPSVRDFVCGALEDGAEVVVDLSDCNYLDSTFLGCLVILHKRGCGHGNRFHVHANGPVREKLLHPTRLDQLLSFCARPPETMGAHVTLQVTDLERDEFGRHLLATHDELAKLGGPAAGAFERVAAQLRRELGES